MIRRFAGALPTSFPALFVASALTLLLSGIPPLFAQAVPPTPPTGGEVVGVVVDSAGEPVPAARVRLTEIHREDASHDDGTFRLRSVHPGTYTLVVVRIGYRPFSQRVTITDRAVVQVRATLRTAAIVLGPQIVTGTIGERARDEVVSVTAVLNDAALDRALASTVAGTLANQAGVAVASVGAATARPVIRGLGGDRILVLEDGQRPGDLSSTSGDHAVAVDPITAGRVEVVRGPMSLLYGSSALGGVVNVVREEIPRSLPEHTRGVLSLQSESAYPGGSAGGEVLHLLTPHLAVRAEATARRLGDTRTPAGTLPNTETRSMGAAVGAAIVGRHGHTGGSYRFYDNTYGIPGGFVGSHPEGVDVAMRRHTLKGETEFHFDSFAFQTVQATATYTDYAHEELEKDGDVGTRFGQRQFAGELQARHDSVGPFSLGALGVRAQLRGITTGGSLRTPSTDDVTLSAYAVEEITRGPWQFQLGARYDHARYQPQGGTFIDVGGDRVAAGAREFGAMSGSVGTLVRLADGVRVGASLSRAYRTPDFNELYSNGPHLAANSYEVGDPRLTQETGIGGDLFLRVSKERVQLEVAAFRNQLDDFIAPSSRGRAIESAQGVPLFQYTNEDAVFTGAEGDLQVSLSPSVVAHAVVSHVTARFTGTRAPIPVFTRTATGVDTTFLPASTYPSFVPPLNGRLELRYERPRLFGAVATRMAAEQERLGDFEERTSGYAVLDASVGYRILAGSRLHTITLRADNVLDTEYRQHLSRTKSIVPEPGINLGLLYRLTF